MRSFLPLVRQLAAQCGDAGKYLHWGATTQDIMDTAVVLQVRDAFGLPFAPEVSTSAIVTYRRPALSGEMFFTTEHVYRSEMFGGPDNIDDAKVDSWDEFNFRLGYRSDNAWSATFWVENAFDAEYFERGWENADENNEFGYGLFNELVWPSRPRSVGVTFSKDWQ